MDDATMRPEAARLEANVLKAALPFQAMWGKSWFDLPLLVFSESLRFWGQRLQAQGEFLGSLRSCRTVPDVMEAQSKFARTVVNDYGAETNKIMDDIRASVNKAA